MYAICVGVRNQFFSLNSFSEDRKTVEQKMQDIANEWEGPYGLDPSWDESLNGLGNNSLVWCRDGATVLTDKHLQNGFFAILVRESKDSEIKLWNPVVGSQRFVFVDLMPGSGNHSLRWVRTFSSITRTMRYTLQRASQLAYSTGHLNLWSNEVLQEKQPLARHISPQLTLSLRKTDDSSVN